MNLAQLLQSQNFALLMQALDLSGALTAGRTVPARLLALEPDGTATAAIGDAKVSLVLAGRQAKEAALQPGATLMLRLEAPERPGGDLRATLVEIRPSPAPQGQPPAPQGPSPQGAAPAAGTAPQPTPAASPAPGAPSPPAAAAPAAAAGIAVPAAAPPGSAPPVAGTIAAAAPAHEAGAGAAAGPQGATIPMSVADTVRAAAAGPGAPPAAPPVSARALIGPMLGAALQRQDSLAPLFANLRGVSDGALALALPKTMLAAAERVLAQAVPVERTPLTGPRLQEAVKASGLFMEANAAAGRPPSPTGDLKAALVALRQTLEPLIEAFGPAPQAGRPAAAEAGPALRDGMPLPPPRRDGPLAPQPAAERSIVAGDPPAAIAAKLLEQTDAALDRIKLTQYASLPPEAPRAESPQAAPQRWMAEVPLAFQHGTAILPLQVERDPPRRSVEGVAPPVWRIRFALDVEPMGPLQGVVTLQGRAVGVTLWAEREDTGQMLRGAAPDLESALLHADFGSGSVDVHTGRPQVAQPTAGQFLDRLS